MKPPALSLLVLCSYLVPVTGGPGAGDGTWDKFARLPYPEDSLFLHDTFPQGFMWSVGTSAYQVEGGCQQDGKGWSIWDTFARKYMGANGSVSSDSYNNLEGDLAAIQSLGVTYYRFSIAWSRIFPDRLVLTKFNEAGLRYYINLIQRLRDIGVEPMVTLYHWDLPQTLQDMYGGWFNETLVDRFSEYAEFCFQRLGDRVKYWITIDNPYAIAWHGYGTGKLAPGVRGAEDVPYRVAHNLIKAHSKVWHLYNDRYRKTQQGHVSIALASHWVGPKNEDLNVGNIKLCQCSINSVLGWFAKPIFIDGDYPECMKDNLKSLLPLFDDGEKMDIKETADFFALSFGPLSFRLLDPKLIFKQSKKYFLRQLLSWIKMEYNNPKIFIVENGWDDNSSTKTEDVYSMYSLKVFLMDVLKAIKYDDVDVIGYTAWSLVDGFEWDAGYSIRRGLFYVDMLSKEKERIPKSSALFYQQVIADRGFPPSPENRPIRGLFPCNFSWGISEDVIQVETTPTSPQFVDRNVYKWDLNSTGKLVKIKGVIGKTRKPQCTDYSTIRQEIHLLRNTHVTHFQFSLNWSLILLSANSTQASKANLRYYKCYISELLRVNITPVVVLYHPILEDLGLPSALEDSGGWLNAATVHAFVDYARLCFNQMGSKVKFWLTMSEPNGIKHFAEYKSNFTIAGHNLLKAHALTWHLYNTEYRKKQNGQVSVSLHADWVDPADPFSRSDIEAAARTLEFDITWFADPIFGNGDYPFIMRDWLSQQQRANGHDAYLPYFTNEERELVRGSGDFVALNHFTTHIVHQETQSNPELKVHHLKDTTWLVSPDRRAVVPWGLRKLLRWIKSKYGNVPIYITSNGIDDNSPINDKLRVYYIQNYINEALKALKLDGVNLHGYFAWALRDIDEPNNGSTIQTGNLNPQSNITGELWIMVDFLQKKQSAVDAILICIHVQNVILYISENIY
ncbi:klotho [Callorhinchus milii]|nr:klotho [Callorhinchus milii]